MADDVTISWLAEDPIKEGVGGGGGGRGGGREAGTGR
jgi:hypothetical protein